MFFPWKSGKNTLFLPWKNDKQMLVRKIDKYLHNYFSSNRNALLVTGARQVGKTSSIRRFGQTYKDFVEINFIDNPGAAKIFKDATGVKNLLFRLSAMVSKPLTKGDTLIFLDEVQECPEAVTAIKFLVEEGSYRYILSGSLLGVELKDLRSEPVGFMGVKEMFPLDFEEFLMNIGMSREVLDAVRGSWENLTPVDNFVHEKLIELFRLYLVVGGMPLAVDKYLETNNLQTVITIQQDILHLYRRDISKYDPDNKLYIDEIFDLIPSELNDKNKRFILKRLNENAKFDRMENSFLWLKDAGVSLPVYNVEEPKIPLLLARSRNLFKLFQSDVGLLACQYAEGIQLRIISGDKDINFGSIYENVVAQELVAHGLTPYYYNSKKRGELDFVIERGGAVLPIEVKSGKDYECHRALSNVMVCEEYDISKALVFSNSNLRVEGKIIYAPIYMVMFLMKDVSAPTHYSVDLSGLTSQAFCEGLRSHD